MKVFLKNCMKLLQKGIFNFLKIGFRSVFKLKSSEKLNTVSIKSDLRINTILSHEIFKDIIVVLTLSVRKSMDHAES